MALIDAMPSHPENADAVLLEGATPSETSKAPSDEALKAADAMCAEGNRMMLSGSIVGAATVASAVLLGATCPLCIVGLPALIGFGAVTRIRGELQRRSARSGTETPPLDDRDAVDAEMPHD